MGTSGVHALDDLMTAGTLSETENQLGALAIVVNSIFLCGRGASHHHAADHIHLLIYCCVAKAYAFWKSRNHGPFPFHSAFISRGYQLLLSAVTTRSGCGMIASTRPFAVCTAAIPSGLPLGFCGY